MNNSLLLYNKPYRLSSFGLIKKLRAKLNLKKIGHAGTLDPLATGLMILATGSATKKLQDLSKLPKEYTGVFVLGAETDSYDLESFPQNFKNFSHLSAADIEQLPHKFIGEIWQTPPMFSAIKKNGQVMYKLARKGININLPPRLVTLYDFQITNIRLPLVSFKVNCSSGTYIRSLIHDCGQYLQTGAYLKQLCRTEIGNFKLSEALDI